MNQSGSESAHAGAEPVVDTDDEPLAPEQQPDAHDHEPLPRAKRPWWLRRYTFTGTAVGLLFLWLSMTPSLLPRGPLFQGLVSGVSGAIGYALGVFSVWLVRYMRSKDASPPAPQIAWFVLVGAGVVGTVLMIVWFHVWQDDVRNLVGVPHLKWHDYPVAAVLAIVVLFALVEVGQLIRRLILFLVRRLNHVVPPRVSAVIAVLVVVTVIVGVLNGVVLRLTMRTLNNTFETVNNEESPTAPPPTTMLRSGGPGSLVSWASLGHQGRIFVAGAQSTQQLSAFNGAPALEPIRAYAGLESANGIQATAELAARELERTGGLTRKVVAVATTTGTGWINEAEADAIEYMFNGDTAIVSMQYSFLPSWLSFLVDKENARHAGQELFEAVSARVRALPEAARPKLVVFGESLGSFGAEAPFLSANNIVARTDGALFSGPTFNNAMWNQITR
ncbi:MAG: alpha/beta-hydrolase family protein, partial [Mycobacterium sp.]|nr:alpha/beta-hydrolase family protein [Mycobacterium sp.]